MVEQLREDLSYFRMTDVILRNENAQIRDELEMKQDNETEKLQITLLYGKKSVGNLPTGFSPLCSLPTVSSKFLHFWNKIVTPLMNGSFKLQ